MKKWIKSSSIRLFTTLRREIKDSDEITGGIAKADKYKKNVKNCEELKKLCFIFDNSIYEELYELYNKKNKNIFYYCTELFSLYPSELLLFQGCTNYSHKHSQPLFHYIHGGK